VNNILVFFLLFEKTKTLIGERNYTEANRTSSNAKIFMIISTIVGVICIGIFIILGIVSASTYNSYRHY